MKDLNWFTSMFSSDPSKGDAVSASAMNVTKIVSIFVALAAGLTQGLKSADVAPLTSNQMVVIWLTVGGLVVLICIADMFARAYVTAKTSLAHQIKLDVPLPVDVVDLDGQHRRRSAELRYFLDGTDLAGIRYDGEDEDNYVPIEEVRRHE